jgi:hypothetical protein
VQGASPRTISYCAAVFYHFSADNAFGRHDILPLEEDCIMADRLPPITPNAVIDSYKKDVDLTLIRENLKLTPEQRLQKHEQLRQFAEELQKAGRAAMPQ